MSESPALFVLVAIATIPITILAYVGVTAIWDWATYVTYLWRHRRFLKF